MPQVRWRASCFQHQHKPSGFTNYTKEETFRQGGIRDGESIFALAAVYELIAGLCEPPVIPLNRNHIYGLRSHARQGFHPNSLCCFAPPEATFILYTICKQRVYMSVKNQKTMGQQRFPFCGFSGVHPLLRFCWQSPEEISPFKCSPQTQPRLPAPAQSLGCGEHVAEYFQPPGATRLNRM
jgi:hypothetical protein